MLGKLLKYDMRYVSRIMVVVYIIALSVSLLISGLIFLSFKVEEVSILLLMSLPMAFLALAAVSVSGLIMIAIRTYKNLYSDEGYLTFTLPVTGDDIIWCKVILYIVWQLLGMIVAAVCVAIPILVAVLCAGDGMIDTVKYFFDYICFYIKDTIGFVGNSFNVLAIVSAIYYLISFISAPVIIIFSFSVGQFAKKHRILMAVAVYYAYSVVASTIYTIVEVILIEFSSDAFYASSANLALTELTLFYAIVSAISLVLTSVCYLFTKNIMANKLNLN